MPTWWDSVESVGRLNTLVLACAAGFGVVAAILVAASWFTGTRLSDLQDTALDKFKTNAGVQIAQANQKVAEASVRVAGLEESAANARAEMAKQQARAAAAEQSLLELQTRLAHRRISPSERKMMASKLLPYTGSIVAVTKLGEAEAGQFADDLLAVFTDAGWKIRTTFVGSMIPPLYGVRCVIDTRTKAGQELANVLGKLPNVSIHEARRDPPFESIVGEITVGLRPPA